jgi:hypothetical protein
VVSPKRFKERDPFLESPRLLPKKAAGIDQQAHSTAISAGGQIIAVLGTPLIRPYPAATTRLQERIAREHLLLPQVPFLRYQQNNDKENAQFFRDRDATSSPSVQLPSSPKPPIAPAPS